MRGMLLRRGRIGRMVAAVGLVFVTTFTAVAVGATPASAATAHGAWSSFPTVCQSCSGVHSGNLVKMWQFITYSAVGGLGTCASFADKSFGPKTNSATKTWQKNHQLSQDGQVGPNTWGKAQTYLQFHASQAGYDFYWYEGGNLRVWFRRSQSNGNWEFQAGFGSSCNAADEVNWIPATY